MSPFGFKIDFKGGPYFWIFCRIFRYYPKIHFYIHFWNLNSRKKFLDTKKNHYFWTYENFTIWLKNTILFSLFIMWGIPGKFEIWCQILFIRISIYYQYVCSISRSSYFLISKISNSFRFGEGKFSIKRKFFDIWGAAPKNLFLKKFENLSVSPLRSI